MLKSEPWWYHEMTIDNNDNDNDNNHYCYDQYDHVTEINFGSVSRFGGLAPPPPHPYQKAGYANGEIATSIMHFRSFVGTCKPINKAIKATNKIIIWSTKKN